MLNIISLGAGVQSSTMALMAAHGEITPMPDCAIFADTQAEPRKVYEWLDWLEKQLPFPVHRVTQGDFAAEATRIRTSKTGTKYQKHSPPAFTAEHGKPTGLLMRQCTMDFKLAPLYRKYRQLGGKKSGVTQWVGISFDEAQRMKPAKEPWLTSIWPLVERRLTRQHCFEWMKRKGYPRPPRSACVFCPYLDNSEWRRLRDEEPEEFARAAKWEIDLQDTFAQVDGFRGEVFLHRDLKRITEVDIDTASPQIDMFGNECEGMCGV